MSELAALMTIYGAIDDAVVENPGLTPTVAALLPAYDQGAAGWFDWAVNWTEQAAAVQAGEPVAPVARPSIDDALRELADPEVYTDLWATRRLLAIAVLSRITADPTIAPSRIFAQRLTDLDADIAGALVPVVENAVLPDYLNSDEAAGELLDLLRDTRSYPTIEHWSLLTADGIRRGLIPDAVGRQVMIPCSWTVIPSTAAGGVAVAFETRMRVRGAPMADIEQILTPTDWTNFRPPWCEMAPRTGVLPGTNRIKEVIGLKCRPDAYPYFQRFRLATILDFKYTDDLPVVADNGPPVNGKALEYRLADDQREGDGLVTVDEGSLVLWFQDKEVHVVTSKRIQFKPLARTSSTVAARLAQFVWHFGYVSLVEFFIYSVVGGTGYVVHVDRSDRTKAVTSGKSSPTGPKQTVTAPRPTPASQQLASAVQEAMDECWGGVSTSLTKMAAGQYGPAAYVGDLSKLTSHVGRHGARFLKVGAALTAERLSGPGTP